MLRASWVFLVSLVLTSCGFNQFVELAPRNQNNITSRLGWRGRPGQVFTRGTSSPAPTPTPAPPPPSPAVPPPTITGIPIINAAMLTHMRKIFMAGMQRTSAPPVDFNQFSYVGDSISAFATSKYDLGDPSNAHLNLGDYGYLGFVINQFRTPRPDNAGLSSLSDPGYAVWPGWAAFNGDPVNGMYDTQSYIDNPTYLPLFWPGFEPSYVLAIQQNRANVCQGQAPLVCELKQSHSFLAIIMLGTNDLGLETQGSVADQAQKTADALLFFGQVAISMGVIPVFSSIPARAGNDLSGFPMAYKVPAFNAAIQNVAQSLNVPFWDFNPDVVRAANFGLGPDGTHLSAAPTGSIDFSNAGLQYGANLRNLELLVTLNKITGLMLNTIQPD